MPGTRSPLAYARAWLRLERPGDPKVGRNQPGKGRRQIHEPGNGSGPKYADCSGVRDPAPGGFESSGGVIDQQKDFSFRLRQQDRTPLSLVKRGKGRVVRRLDGSNFYPLRKFHRPLAHPAWSAIVDQLVQHLDRDDNSSIQSRQKIDGFNEN
jgi:hypothetical protein